MASLHTASGVSSYNDLNSFASPLSDWRDTCGNILDTATSNLCIYVAHCTATKTIFPELCTRCKKDEWIKDMLQIIHDDCGNEKTFSKSAFCILNFALTNSFTRMQAPRGMRHTWNTTTRMISILTSRAFFCTWFFRCTTVPLRASSIDASSLFKRDTMMIYPPVCITSGRKIKAATR